ncbi:hypothetical protein HS5_06520 [Acidianus sp. HS-5]|nr:hypothetical protein HS5_06520 [Acidianus sp. HS-5]
MTITEVWTDLSSFFYFMGINYKSQLLSQDKDLPDLYDLMAESTRDERRKKQYNSFL